VFILAFGRPQQAFQLERENMKFTKTFAAAMAVTASLMGAAAAQAGEADSCKAVRFADVGWTDIQVITGIASNLFEALGYAPEVKTLSVPVTYESMKNKDIDVFLGNWMPSMTENVKPYLADKSVDQLQPANLEGAGYGIVVPQYVADAGVKSIADLAAHKDEFGGKFYGIESGNDGNRIIQSIIDDKKNNLAGFELVESSEAGMLTEAEKAIKDKNRTRSWVTWRSTISTAWIPTVLAQRKCSPMNALAMQLNARMPAS
jgi:glycine betaine/proline transport system substrate-binding protein